MQIHRFLPDVSSATYASKTKLKILKDEREGHGGIPAYSQLYRCTAASRHSADTFGFENITENNIESRRREKTHTQDFGRPPDPGGRFQSRSVTKSEEPRRKMLSSQHVAQHVSACKNKVGEPSKRNEGRSWKQRAHRAALNGLQLGAERTSASNASTCSDRCSQLRDSTYSRLRLAAKLRKHSWLHNTSFLNSSFAIEMQPWRRK